MNQNTGDPAIMDEISAGLARMRAEKGIPQPSRMPRVAFFGFLFAFSIIGAVVFGVVR